MKAARSVLKPAALAGPQAPLAMTLSAFASVNEHPLPGRYHSLHEQAILTDLGLALRQAAPNWSPVWAGLSSDGAYMAYIAHNEQATNEYAVVIRGTDFDILSNDWDDFYVWETAAFPTGGRIAQGISDAHNQLITAAGSSGRTLGAELAARVVSGGRGSTIFVTGHSLGGALATTVALYLQAALPQAVFQVYTFASPTAGLTDFAGIYDQTFPGNGTDANSSWRVYNLWDAVPQAWQSDTLSALPSWYPAPGPAPSDSEWATLEGLQWLPAGQPYQQPSVNVCQLNDPSWQAAYKNPQADFADEIAFQHNCNTYLTLLNAANVAVLSSVSPNALCRGMEVPLTMSGLGFSDKTTVAFSNEGISVHSTALENPSVLKVTVSVTAGAQDGPCDLILTSENGDRIPGGTSSFFVTEYQCS